MTRRLQARVEERWDELFERLQTGFRRFRESRLYVQLISAAILLLLGWLLHLLPAKPWGPLQSGLRWVVSADYDFRGEATRWNEWAQERGGWLKAGAGLWQQGVAQLQDWSSGSESKGPADLVADPLAGAPIGPPIGPAAPPVATRPNPAKPINPDSLTQSPPLQPTSPDLGGPATANPGEAASPQGEASPANTAPGPSAEGGQLPPLLPVEGSLLWEYGWLPPGVGDAFHEGIDFLAKVGTPVVAILDGTVVAVRHDANLGQVVEVRHGAVIGSYAQVEGVEVQAGDEVRRGQLIAVVARAKGSEESLPPHLHFEIRPTQSGEPVDPASYLGIGGKKL